MWVLTPYIGAEADSQRTAKVWILPEMPRKEMWFGSITAVLLIPLVAMPLMFIAPVNWGIALGIWGAALWAYSSRTKGLRIRKYQRIIDMLKAKNDQPVFAGGSLRTDQGVIVGVTPGWVLPPNHGR